MSTTAVLTGFDNSLRPPPMFCQAECTNGSVISPRFWRVPDEALNYDGLKRTRILRNLHCRYAAFKLYMVQHPLRWFYILHEFLQEKILN